jgi:hypothetical protein
MTDDQITALARGYAEEINPVNELNNYPDAKVIADIMRNALSEVTAEHIKNFEGFVRFLLRRFCLVEKETVRKAFWQLTDKLLSDGDNKSFGAAYVVLQSLFPEIAKEVEE